MGDADTAPDAQSHVKHGEIAENGIIETVNKTKATMHEKSGSDGAPGGKSAIFWGYDR